MIPEVSESTLPIQTSLDNELKFLGSRNLLGVQHHQQRIHHRYEKNSSSSLQKKNRPWTGTGGAISKDCGDGTTATAISLGNFIERENDQRSSSMAAEDKPTIGLYSSCGTVQHKASGYSTAILSIPGSR